MKEVINLTKTVEEAVLIEHLKQAEFNRDYLQTMRLFANVWDVYEEPNFNRSGDSATAGELYQLSGEFLMEYGKAKNIPDWQERSKNALDQAISCYEKSDQPEKAIFCRMLVAVSRRYKGLFNDFQTLLDYAESWFEGKKTHPIYLQIQINHSICETKYENYISARCIIDRIESLVSELADDKINILFFNQAGIVYRNCNESEKALEYFEKALRTAEKLNILHYRALVMNCIANTHRVLKNIPAALFSIRRALRLVADDSGWAAHFLDTKALIHYDDGDFDAAHDCIDQSINIFERGDDVAGYVEALWTKMRILFKFSLNVEAHTTFAQLYTLAKNNIGEEVAAKYATRYDEITVAVPDGGDLYTKLLIVKKSLVGAALKKADGQVKKAAGLLGLYDDEGVEKHQTVSRILKKEFPDLRLDYSNLDERKTRSDSENPEDS